MKYRDLAYSTWAEPKGISTATCLYSDARLALSR
jgi:hypothetical protein